MPIISSEILRELPKPGNRRKVLEIHTDQLGQLYEKRYNAIATDDTSALLVTHAAEIESRLPDFEANEGAARSATETDITPNHQTQSQLDKGIIRVLMGEPDVSVVAKSIPWFRSFEIRAGANANARASYLGVTRAAYDLVAERFNQVQGLADGLRDDALRVWYKVPGGW